MLQTKPQTQDVIVIGAGITGLSCAYHLLKSGLNKLTILQSSSNPSVTKDCAGYAIGGCFDNFTRVLQAHGPESAAEFWHFGNQACESLSHYLTAQYIPFHSHERLRLLTSTHEVAEAEKAVAAMNQAGFSAYLDDPDKHANGALTERVLGCQVDDHAALSLPVGKLIDVLTSELSSFMRVGHVTNIQTDSEVQSVSVQDTAKPLQAEVVVIANHLALGSLVPNLQSAIISYADQYFLSPRPSTNDAVATSAPAPGTFYSANHGYEWGVFSEDSVALGGARFLRPLAGFEAKTASVQPHIRSYIQEQFTKTFQLPSLEVSEQNEFGLLDCRPCDELPIIGPMYGESRLLVATGFMGAGLTLGFLAGKCLAELITNGSSAQLPRIFWPERLRTLPESR